MGFEAICLSKAPYDKAASFVGDPLAKTGSETGTSGRNRWRSVARRMIAYRKVDRLRKPLGFAMFSAFQEVSFMQKPPESTGLEGLGCGLFLFLGGLTRSFFLKSLNSKLL